MQPQISNRYHETVGFECKKRAHVWRSVAIGAVMLLATAVSLRAQSASASEPDLSGLTYGPTTCSSGGNQCMSPQYRSGASSHAPGSPYNANLTGTPLGDSNILNPSTVNSTNLVLLTSIPAPGHGGCQVPYGDFGLQPTASPSIESRIVFPARDADGVCALFTYDVTFPSAPQYVVKIGAGNSHVTSSPGYSNARVFIGAEDGNVYAYYFASNTLAWTFTNPWGWGFDASPGTWPGLDYVYVVDVAGHVFFLDPSDGTVQHLAITDTEIGGRSGNYGDTSASSIAVSTALNKVFVAGQSNWDPYGDQICALDATTAQGWCQNFAHPPNPVAEDSFMASSPVISDSLGLVYETDQGDSNTPTSGTANLYAIGVNSGDIAWEVPLFLPSPSALISFAPLPYGGSPAYDDSANHNASKYLITATPINCYDRLKGKSCGQFSAIQIFDATLAGKGKRVCGTTTTHLISQSSPEVVDGVIYVGTDDGYVLAFDETQCSAGKLPEIWTSSPQMLNPTTGAPDPLTAPPVVSYNRIHALAQSGTLYVWHRPGW